MEQKTAMILYVKLLIFLGTFSVVWGQGNMRAQYFFEPNERFQYYQGFQNQIPAPYNQPMTVDKFPFQYFDTEMKNQFDFVKADVVRTLAENAIAYWTDNNCVYPPKDFYPVFERSCSEVYNENNIYSGLCRTFFNASQEICELSGAEPVEKETMLNITQLQSDVTDDDICDTLVGMKQAYTDLFPKPVGENVWFSHTNNLLFRNESCPDVCQMENMHPLCFGILLTYDYINDEKLAIEFEKEIGMIDDYIEDDYVESDEYKDLDADDAKIKLEEDVLIDKLLEDFEVNYDDLIDTEKPLEAMFDDFDLDMFVDKTPDIPDNDLQFGLEKYYEYKAFNEDPLKDDKDEILFDIEYMEFGNPKILNKLLMEQNIDFDKLDDESFIFSDDFPNDKLRYESIEFDDYNQDDGSLMGAVFAFSCLLLLVMLAYIFKMRHRLFGRGNRQGRPNRWNYKKLSTDNGHSY